MPGTFFGSSTFTPPMVSPLPSAIGFLRRLPIDRRDVVAVALRCRRLEFAGRPLRVIGGPEHPAIRHFLAGIPQVEVERRQHDLPAERHLTRLRVDLDSGDNPFVFGRVLFDGSCCPLRDGYREAGAHHRVFGVRRNEGAGVIAGNIGDRSQNLLGFEIAKVDARDPSVHVVHEQPSAVVVAVGFR